MYFESSDYNRKRYTQPNYPVAANISSEQKYTLTSRAFGYTKKWISAVTN